MNLRRLTLLPTWLAAFILVPAVSLAPASAQAAQSKAPQNAQSQAASKADTRAVSPPNQKAAEKPGDKKPADEPDTLILSDTLNYDDLKKESIFTGNVIMTRGLMTLRSDTLAMHQDPQGFQYGTATVGPNKLVFIRQETPEKFEVIEAKGLRAEYNGKTDEIEMIGQAVITKFVCGQPFDTISGERVKYNQKTNIYQAFSGPNSAARGGRVRSLATPGAKADAAAASCKQKSAKG